jgi:integrase
MMIRARGSGYQVQVYVGRDDDGRRRWVNRTARTLKEARDLEAKLRLDTSGKTLVKTSATYGVLLDDWLKHLQGQGLSPKTLSEYERLVETVLRPRLGSKRVGSITVRQIDSLYSDLSGKGKSPSTVHNVHTVLSRSLAQGVNWGWLMHNPALDASPPPVRRTEITPPSANDLDRLLAALDDDPDFRTLVWLAVVTGARRGEIVALRWRDVDLDAEMTIRSNIVHTSGTRMIEKDTKTHAVRRLALDHVTVDVLRDHRDRCDKRAADCGVKLVSGAYVFSREVDGSAHLIPNSVGQRFRRLTTILGIRSRLHDLRHFAATNMVASGVDVRTVAGRLGHADASTTLKVYASFLAIADRNAAGVVSSMLKPLSPPPA